MGVMINLWRNIKGYEGHYIISKFGNVMSIKIAGKEVILKPFTVDDNEDAVMLWKDGKRKCYTIKALLKDNWGE